MDKTPSGGSKSSQPSHGVWSLWATRQSTAASTMSILRTRMFIETLSYSVIPFGVCLRMQAQKPDQSPECLGHACPLLLCSRPVMA